MITIECTSIHVDDPFLHCRLLGHHEHEDCETNIIKEQVLLQSKDTSDSNLSLKFI